MVAPVLDSSGECNEQMKIHLSIFAILLSVAAASAQAQDSTATYLESNVRYSQSQMIVLLKSCAPHAALNTMLAVATTESDFHPYAISVNRPQKLASSIGLNNQAIELARQPNSKLEAIFWMRWLLRHHISVSVGLLQVSTENAARFHLNPEQLFDPCTNIAVGANLLAEAYAAQMQAAPYDPDALLHALSVYNSGTANFGFYNGYVDRILKNAKL
jgi:type IV secretion system protein VirB1